MRAQPASGPPSSLDTANPPQAGSYRPTRRPSWASSALAIRNVATRDHASVGPRRCAWRDVVVGSRARPKAAEKGGHWWPGRGATPPASSSTSGTTTSVARPPTPTSERNASAARARCSTPASAKSPSLLATTSGPKWKGPARQRQLERHDPGLKRGTCRDTRTFLAYGGSRAHSPTRRHGPRPRTGATPQPPSSDAALGYSTFERRLRTGVPRTYCSMRSRDW